MQVAKSICRVSFASSRTYGCVSTILIDRSLDKPFLDAEPDEVYEVTFQLTRDMFWFDVTARKMQPSPNPDVEASVLEFSLD